MRILIAEDERITRRSLQRQLESWGHDVVAAEDGAAAWEQFQQRPFDIVVTDWDMPYMDGRELIQHIRRSGQSGYAYSIMLTGRSEKADYTKSREETTEDKGLTPPKYRLTRELLRDKAKPEAIVLHSLPRMDELPTYVDQTRHARYCRKPSTAW